MRTTAKTTGTTGKQQTRAKSFLCSDWKKCQTTFPLFLARDRRLFTRRVGCRFRRQTRCLPPPVDLVQCALFLT